MFKFIRIIPRFLYFWMDFFLTHHFPQHKKIHDSRSSGIESITSKPWVFWCHQVEIEYFLALMAQLPVGSDLPETAKTKLREIPAKLTIENAKDERTENPTHHWVAMVSSMFFPQKSRWRVHEFLGHYFCGEVQIGWTICFWQILVLRHEQKHNFTLAVCIVSKLRDP